MSSMPAARSAWSTLMARIACATRLPTNAASTHPMTNTIMANTKFGINATTTASIPLKYCWSTVTQFCTIISKNYYLITSKPGPAMVPSPGAGGDKPGDSAGTKRGLFKPYIEPVKHDAVRIVHDVAHQLVVHIEPVGKVLAPKECIAQVAADLALELAHPRAQYALFDAVADDKHVEPPLPLAHKNARDDNQFDGAGGADAPVDIFGAGGRVEQQVLQHCQVLKVRVEHVAQAAAAARRAALDKPHRGKEGKLFARGALVDARALGGVRHGIGLLGVKKEEAQELEPGGAAEEFLEWFSHTVKRGRGIVSKPQAARNLPAPARRQAGAGRR